MKRRPRVAILGAGPVGLDAALAAKEAGLAFTVYEAAAEVGGHVRAWRHVRLFTPWSENVSPRMARALEEEGWAAPDPGCCPTGDELVRRLLEPVAAVPGIAPRVRTGARVIGVSRRGLVKSDAIGSPRRSEPPFRILLEMDGGGEDVEEADLVLDCTGTCSNPNALGDGGLPAPGERAAEEWIVRRIPDVRGEEEEWRGRRVLLVGSGHSAQTAARDLAGLVDGADGVRVLWAVRSEEPEWGAVTDDPLPGRRELVRTSRALASGQVPGVEVRTGVVVDALEITDGSVRVALRPRFGEPGTGKERDTVDVDRVVSLTGSVGDPGIYRQLQVHECYATSGPMKLAAALLGSDSDDCLDQSGHGADSLVNPEPGFFLLGAKSYGRNNTFLMRVGWEQVDDVFGLVESEARGA